MLEKIFTQLESSFWSYNLLGNTIKEIFAAIVVFIVLLIIFKLFQTFVLRHLTKLARRTKTNIDDALIEIVQTIKPPFYSFLAFYLAFSFLTINQFAKKIVDAILIIWIVYQAIIVVQILIDYIINKGLDKGEEANTKTAISIIGKISKIILWVLGILLILSNLGINITSLIAGLGIGGIAVALALQNILSDLFSSFAIYFDKPFAVGDFIIVGEHKGVVEKIGIKTTRIKALQGEEVVISNQELTSTRIQNFKKMQKRRVVFSFGVIYETPSAKLEKIPQIVKGIIDSIELVNFNRAHFKEFADSALSFEVVYYVETGDYAQYMDVNQEINFRIKKIFEKEEISMAYPTQTIYLENKR